MTAQIGIDIGTVITVVISVALAAVGVGWKVSQAISNSEKRLGDKITSLSERVGRIEGLLEGLGFSGKLPTKSSSPNP